MAPCALHVAPTLHAGRWPPASGTVIRIPCGVAAGGHSLRGRLDRAAGNLGRQVTRPHSAIGYSLMDC